MRRPGHRQWPSENQSLIVQWIKKLYSGSGFYMLPSNPRIPRRVKERMVFFKVTDRYQEIQKATSDIKWKHSWMVYKKGTEKEPLRNLNKKINLPLFALESLFLMSAQLFFETFTIKLHSAKGKQNVYLSAGNCGPVSAQDCLCPLYSCCNGKYSS